MTLGPLQMVAIAFDSSDNAGVILETLDGLADAGIVRVLDVLVVEKDQAGNSVAAEVSDLGIDERIEYGAAIGALLGVGAAGEAGAEAGAELGALAALEGRGLGETDMAALRDEIPAGGAGFFALVEHRWLGEVRELVEEAGGRPLTSAFVTPEGLKAAGAELGRLLDAAD